MILLSVEADHLRFLPNGALFPSLCSKNDLSNCWVFSPSLQTCMHALKRFHINQIVSFADGFMPYLHCYDYINPEQMQEPHKSLLIVSIGSMCPWPYNGMWPQLVHITRCPSDTFSTFSNYTLTFCCQ